jgi:hypothetical protein
MEDLSSRTAQEVLDDHLNLAENWGGKVGFERGLEEDLRRNSTEDIVIIYRAVEGRMAFLEWAYEDDNVRVRDGADSYLIENGKIVAQTIYYTVEQK